MLRYIDTSQVQIVSICWLCDTKRKQVTYDIGLLWSSVTPISTTLDCSTLRPGSLNHTPPCLAPWTGLHFQL